MNQEVDAPAQDRDKIDSFGLVDVVVDVAEDAAVNIAGINLPADAVHVGLKNHGLVDAPEVDVDVAEDAAVNFARMDLPADAVHVGSKNHDTLQVGGMVVERARLAGMDLPVADVAEEASAGNEMNWNESLAGVVVYEGVGMDLNSDGGVQV